MILARHEKIMQMVRQSGKVLVDELAAEFDVTSQTIRKDLNELCDRQMLLRVHGGAMLLSSVENMAYEARRSIARDQKARIGTAAAALIPDNASLFVNIGTTTEAVAKALLAHIGLMIVTNNINVANVIRPVENNQVIIAGGVVRASDGGIVGEAAVDFIKQFKVDFAIIGASAIDSEGALLDYDFREVKVAQAILENANTVILVADNTKHERTAPVRIGHISMINTFVTDRCPDEKFRKLLQDLDVRLIEIEGDEI
jgi:DeoR family glycerol-3-phosphate regulon repressor